MKSGRSENVSRVVEAVLPVPPSSPPPPASNHAPPHNQVKFANDLAAAANSNPMVGNFISPSRNLASSVNYPGGVIKRNSVVPPIAAAGESKKGQANHNPGREKTSDEPEVRVDVEQPAAVAATRVKRPSVARSEDGEFVFHSKE